MPSPAARVEPAAAPRPALRATFIAQASLLGATLAIYALVVASAGLQQQDLAAYLGGGRAIIEGRPLYGPFLQHPFPDPALRPAFIYPPAFALLLAPLAALPRAAAALAWIAVCQAALITSLLLVRRWLRPSPWALTAMVVVAATFYPLWIDVAQGQANLLILLLVTVGLVGVLQGHDRHGAAFGIAAALKLTPALLLIWLLVDRRWRAAAWMAAAFVGVTAASALLRLEDTWTFFSRVLPALAHGTAFYANQSLGGFLSRVVTSNPYTDAWVALPLPLLLGIAAALLIGWWTWRTWTQPADTRALAFIPLLPLLSSLTWPHHFVILLPLIWAMVLALAARRWAWQPTAVFVGCLAIFSIVPRWPVGPAFGESGFRAAQTGDPLVVLAANAFLIGTLGLFLLAPWLLRAR